MLMVGGFQTPHIVSRRKEPGVYWFMVAVLAAFTVGIAYKAAISN